MCKLLPMNKHPHEPLLKVSFFKNKMFKAAIKAKGSMTRGEKKNQCLNNFNGLTWPQKMKKFIFFFSWDLIQSPLRPKEGFPPIPMCAGSVLCSAAPSLCCADGLTQQLPPHPHPSALCSA